MHDNDYTAYWYILAHAVRELCLTTYQTNIEESDLKDLEIYVQHLWYSLYNFQHRIDYYKRINRDKAPEDIEPYQESPLDNFGVFLEIVDFRDIPSWNNEEDIYVALFETYDSETDVFLV